MFRVWFIFSLLATPVLFWYLFIQPLGELKYIDPPRPQSSQSQVTTVPRPENQVVQAPRRPTSVSPSGVVRNSDNQLFTGVFRCDGDEYTLEFEITSASGNGSSRDLEGVFTFFVNDDRPADLHSGSFLMKGSIDRDSKQYSFRPIQWVIQPQSGYRMIALDGTMGNGQYFGKLMKTQYEDLSNLVLCGEFAMSPTHPQR